MTTTDPARYPCVFTGQTADGREVGWERGEWIGDLELCRRAHLLRGDDRSMEGTAASIAAVVGDGGAVSETVTALLGEEG